MMKHLMRTALVLALCTIAVPMAVADPVYNVTLNTSALADNSSQGPFAIDFQLNDGSNGDGVGNNTATLSNFTLTGGSLTAGTGSSSGGVSGDLSNILTITDNGFFNDFNQQFTPGSKLSFTLDLTTNVSPSEHTSPDQFSFTVYSNNFANTASLLTIDITGPNPVISSLGGSLGNGVSVPGPSVQPSIAAPEPASLTLFALGLATMATGCGLQRRRAVME